jgi:hypothetical protein
MRQFDQDEDAKKDKKHKADKMRLLISLFLTFETRIPLPGIFLFAPGLHPASDIKEKTDDRDDAAQYTSRYQQAEIHVRCVWWKKIPWRQATQ